VLTIRRILLAALLCTLVAAVARHADHAGAVEWVVSSMLALVLLYALVTSPRRAT
jgi:hypothetical protein